MTLFLHVGLPKTGSSTIQSLMYAGRELLAQHGVRYWDMAERHSRPLWNLYKAAEKKQSEKSAVRRDTYGDADAIRASLQRCFAQPGSVLISGEGITVLSVESLRDLQAMSGREVKVIAYIREPRSWFASGVQQKIKTGAVFEKAVQSRSYYKRRLDNIIEVFGSSVDARLYKSSPDGKALIHDFMSALGLPEDLVDEVDIPTANTTLSNNAVWFLDAANQRAQALHGFGMQGALRNAVSNLGGGSFRLPQEILDALLKERAEDIAWASDLVGVDLLEIGKNFPSGQRVSYPPDIIDVFCNMAIELRDEKFDIKLREADALVEDGEIDRAKQILRRALNLSPKNEAARSKLIQLNGGEAEGFMAPKDKKPLTKPEKKAKKKAKKLARKETRKTARQQAREKRDGANDAPEAETVQS